MLLQESNAPGAHMHFVAEGEVSFRSVLFIPKDAPRDYEVGKDNNSRNIKVSYGVGPQMHVHWYTVN